MITAGIDIGSITAKAALMEGGRLLGTALTPTGYNPELAAKTVLRDVLSSLGLDDQSVGRIVSTGYGRKSVAFAHKAITEITCHGAGASFLNPGIRFIIDVGGQDSKAILLNGQGKVINFVMNDKCAAGTGRFLEVMARAMDVPLDRMGELAEKAPKPARISSLCTVFAESEVISLIAGGEGRENIIAGIHEAISQRIVAMASRLGLASPIMMTGGVARNSGVVRALTKALGEPIEVSPLAQLTGAIGAALLAGRGP
ncbi:MAG: acyl-CoA dehydratase activase [Smithellaceae bacterium]|nr:acyl-CoA dehydratase activase [Smithellaceae bacterium]